jgi:hypothetical protein
MVHANQGPVSYHPGDADTTIGCWASDEVLNSRSVKQLDMRERENLGEECGGEERLLESE